MPETYKVDEEKGFIDLRITGRLDADAMLDQILTVARIAEETGIRRVLVDNRQLDEMPSSAQTYDLIHRLRQDLRYAIVQPTDMTAADAVRFAETAALNSGVAFRIFEDREQGLEWLLA